MLRKRMAFGLFSYNLKIKWNLEIFGCTCLFIWRLNLHKSENKFRVFLDTNSVPRCRFFRTKKSKEIDQMTQNVYKLFDLHYSLFSPSFIFYWHSCLCNIFIFYTNRFHTFVVPSGSLKYQQNIESLLLSIYHELTNVGKNIAITITSALTSIRINSENPWLIGKSIFYWTRVGSQTRLHENRA